MLSHIYARVQLGLVAAAVLLLPVTGSALSVSWTTDDAVGPNTVKLMVDIICSPNSSLCSGTGLQGNPYFQEHTVGIDGTGTGTLDEGTDTITLDTFSGTADPIVFTGLPAALGGAVAANGVLSLISQAIGSIPGWTEAQDGQTIATSLNGGLWDVTATTNSSILPVIALQLVIDAPGTLAETGVNGLNEPTFELRDLRGSFFFLTATQITTNVGISVSGTIRTTFRATFTLNLSGVGPPIPEPGTFALIGMGILGFGAAAMRRRSS